MPFAYPLVRPAALGAAVLLGTSLAATSALAQEPPPPPAQTQIIVVPTPAPAYEMPPASEAPPVRPMRVIPRSAPYTPLSEWEEGSPVPDGYTAVKRPRKGLLIAGAVTFGSVYLTSALAGAIASDAGVRGGATMIVPVVGPLAMIGFQASATGAFMLVLDSLAQAAGVAMFAVGLARPRAVLRPIEVGKVELAPTPLTFGPSSAGLGLTGRF